VPVGSKNFLIDFRFVGENGWHFFTLKILAAQHNISGKIYFIYSTNFQSNPSELDSGFFCPFFCKEEHKYYTSTTQSSTCLHQIHFLIIKSVYRVTANLSLYDRRDFELQ
jgi:hypothetical protein